VALDEGNLDVAKLLKGRMVGKDSQRDIEMAPLVTQAQDTLPDVAQPFPADEKGPTIFNESGISLHIASKEGNPDPVRSLLHTGTNVDYRDANHQTPLHRASQRGSAELAKLVIKYGADVHARSRSGATSLHAASSGDGHFGRRTVVT